MRVLVTGGAGFVGANLVPYLQARGHEVTVLDDLSAGALPSWWGGRRSGIRQVEGGVEDPQAVRRATRGADAVIHLAAKPGVAFSVIHPEAEHEANVFGTFNVLDAARRGKVTHIVFASSGAVLAGVDPPLREDMAPLPLAPYGASKLYGEGLMWAARAYGIIGVSLRFANVYGPECAHKPSVIAQFVRRALRHRPLVVYGNGRQTRDFLYVDDVCDAIVRSLLRRQPGVYHLGTGIETSVNELARKVSAVCDVPHRVDRRPSRPGEARRSFVDVAAAAKDLGWRPNTPLDEGIARTVDWARSAL